MRSQAAPRSSAPALERELAELRDRGRKAFVPYLMAGFPDRATFRAAARTLVAAGADAIEIGIPFSDPLADGPVIQAAGKAALESGVTPHTSLELTAELRADSPRTPLIVMGYTNSILACGGLRYLEQAAAAGAGGVIVPDLDLGLADELVAMAGAAGLAMIRLLAPTTPVARAREVLRRARGFAYLVSVTGVTGARRQLEFRLGAYVRRIRKLTRLPLYVGFGVSTGAQARALCALADGVIVGSALLETLRGPRPLAALAKLAEALRSGCDRAGDRRS